MNCDVIAVFSVSYINDMVVRMIFQAATVVTDANVANNPNADAIIYVFLIFSAFAVY